MSFNGYQRQALEARFFISPQAFFTIFFRFASIFRPKKKLYSKLYACANPPKVPLQAACEAFCLFDGYRNTEYSFYFAHAQTRLLARYSLAIVNIS